MCRVHDELLTAIDAFRVAQFEPLSRPEALRLLAEIGLNSLGKAQEAAPRKKR